jgi:class 3 adenylate cyclase
MICAVCAQANPDGFRFCGACGAPLGVVASERRERRVVSVLFADLVGFTSRSESLDVEDVEGFLSRYHRVLRGVLQRHGGTVEKFIGDAVMALFGAPVAREDDPERAVRAALSIQDAVAEMRERDGVDLRVRVGVTTGEALIALSADPGAGEGMASGDVVNTAARLQSAAPVDGVLVDAYTHRATERVIRYAAAGAVTAKGKAELVEAWRAVEARSIVPEQARVGGLALVGREVEADTLRGALDRSRREPSTQLVSIIGEPGIGKTRLVEELGSYVEELPGLITWRRGRSLSYGEGVAFWALGEMVKSQAGVLESDSAEVAETKLSEAVTAVIVDEQDRGWVERHLRPLLGLGAQRAVSGEGGRVEAFAAWRRFFEALAEDGTTALVFEDIHWADDALLDFIDLLADRAGAVPLLIVCTARPELLERRATWGGGKMNSATIGLAPLSGQDTARLVGELLNQALLPVEVQRALLDRAEGNPLYAQEYVRMLQDRGLLVQGDGGWTLAGLIEGLPESVQGIIAARLDTLTAEEKALIQDAAVVGKTAWIGAVCALTERAVWEADELLHSLERKQLLQRVRRSQIHGETEFSFSHALTRDVAYSQIRRSDRAQKHEAAAGWIEQLSGQRGDKAELLANHYQHAFALREQLGEDTTSLAPKARAAFSEAAHQAAAVCAHPAAARHYHAALQLTAEDDSERAGLLFGEVTALFNADTADEQTLRAAVGALVAAGEWEAAAGGERMFSLWCEDQGANVEEANTHLALAAEYAARILPSDVMFQIAGDQAFRLLVSGQAEQALGLTTRMIPIAEQADLAVGQALLLQWRGYARIEVGNADGSGDLRNAADTLARNAHPGTPVAYGNLADALRGLGDMPAADAAYATASQWASRFARPYHIAWIAMEQACQAYHAAHWDTAQRLLAQIDTTSAVAHAQVRITRGRISLARGDTQDAFTDATAITSYGTSTDNNDALYYGLALEVLCHAAAGRDEDALNACERFLSRWQETGSMTARATELCEIAPTLTTAGRHNQIRAAALLLPEACRWRTALLHIAEERYAEAATLYAEIGSQPLAADAHLLAARQATHNGRTAQAQQYAEAVSAFAQKAGATLYQQRAEAFLKASA